VSDFWWRQAKGVLLGERLGIGSARKVYQCRIDPGLVVKIEKGGRSFQNVNEWEAWSFLGKKHCHWLAPCLHISSCGAILIQKRAEPIRKGDLPKRIPSFLRDIKLENFGMIDGRLVCIDYGTLPHAIGDSSVKLTKASWR
jgi:hypothetical protein